jgi:carbon catabolite-derepressing protein kinase
MKSPATTVSILLSSLPQYHKAYMSGHPPASIDGQAGLEPPAPARTAEDKAAAARRLKPHSRSSQIALEKLGNPEAMTPMPSKKNRPIKWQFGIRSRNAPAEAMLAIYKALRAMGAEWEVPTNRNQAVKFGAEVVHDHLMARVLGLQTMIIGQMKKAMWIGITIRQRVDEGH